MTDNKLCRIRTSGRLDNGAKVSKAFVPVVEEFSNREGFERRQCLLQVLVQLRGGSLGINMRAAIGFKHDLVNNSKSLQILSGELQRGRGFFHLGLILP